MSDIFDHALDAFESQDRAWNEGYIGRKSNFTRDPLYYHIEVSEITIIWESEKAYCVRWYDDCYFVPKKLCRKINRGARTMYILRSFWNNAEPIKKGRLGETKRKD